jgi:hypothetical protein
LGKPRKVLRPLLASWQPGTDGVFVAMPGTGYMVLRSVRTGEVKKIKRVYQLADHPFYPERELYVPHEYEGWDIPPAWQQRDEREDGEESETTVLWTKIFLGARQRQYVLEPLGVWAREKPGFPDGAPESEPLQLDRSPRWEVLDDGYALRTIWVLN